ncbi:MAG TPA: helix-turn-helix domain-containing protein [Pseudonocardia sp.]|jgi:AcrR family transcriptional regulator
MEVRQALIEAAAELFATKGYSGTGTKEIASAAGTSETTIYRQFGSKSELFSAAVAEPFHDFLAEYETFFERAMQRDDWTDQVITERSIERLYHHLRERRNSVLAMIYVHADPAAAQPARHARERIEAFFAALHQIGVRRWRRDPGGLDVDRLPLNHRFLVAIVFTMAALDSWFVPAGPHRPDEKTLLDAITTFVLRGSIDQPHGGAGPAGVVEQLERLSALHAAGALSTEEFARAKAHVLNA